jgi:NAD(P)-dependent dehydrogenase (short-subunit alcohol dehydrogenase family)
MSLQMGNVTFDFAGRVAVVTGASSGFGVAFAEGLAEAGADVALGARRVERLEQTRARVAELGREAIAVRTDVTEPEDCQRLVDAAMDRFGRIDLLINNAGTSNVNAATREDPATFRHVVDVNLNGSFYMAQACGRVMKPGSAIVNVGSVMGTTTIHTPQAAYVASKTAVNGLTRELANQWTGRKGIRVNTVAPAFFPTEMTAELQGEDLQKVLDRTPVGRLGELAEVVAAVLFLASDAASYISGAMLSVDGGMLTN